MNVNLHLQPKKIVLSPFNDKRYILPDGKNTLTWGHKDVMESGKDINIILYIVSLSSVVAI